MSWRETGPNVSLGSKAGGPAFLRHSDHVPTGITLRQGAQLELVREACMQVENANRAAEPSTLIIGRKMVASLPSTVFIHGLGDRRESTLALSDALKGAVTPWSLDLPGHGGRPMPDRISAEAFARDLVEGIDNAGLEKPYLFGWSYGGRVALSAARQFPDRFRGICLLGTNYVLDHALDLGLKHYDPERKRSVPLLPHELEFFRMVHARILNLRNDPPELSEEDLRSIDLPVLILSGTGDPVVPVEDAKFLYSLLKNVRLVLFEGSAHPGAAIPLAVVAEQFSQFVREVEAG